MNNILLPFALSLPLYLMAILVLRKLRKGQISIMRIAILTFVFHFAILPFVSFFIQYFINGKLESSNGDITKAFKILYSYSLGMVLVLNVRSVLVKSEKNYSNLFSKILNNISESKILVYWTAITAFLMFYKYYYGFTFYGAGTLARNLSVPYPVVVLQNFVNILVFGLIGYGILSIVSRRKITLATLVSTMSNIIVKYDSRRNYIAIFLFYFVSKILNKDWRFPVKKMATVSLIGLFMLQIFFPFLMAFRDSTQKIAYANDGQGGSVIEAFKKAQSVDGSEQEEKRLVNLNYRTNSIDRIVEIQNFPKERGFMNGLCIASQVSFVVPRFLFPQKVNLSGQLGSESAVFFFYRKYPYDYSDNWPVYGYLDFGYQGALLSGCLLMVLLWIFEEITFFLYRFKLDFVAISVLFAVLGANLNHEFSYTSHFGLFRNIILLTIFMIGFIFLKFLISGRLIFRRK